MHLQNAGYDSANTAGPENEALARRLVEAYGVHEVRAGQKARIDFGTPGWFDVSFEPVSRR